MAIGEKRKCESKVGVQRPSFQKKYFLNGACVKAQQRTIKKVTPFFWKFKELT